MWPGQCRCASPRRNCCRVLARVDRAGGPSAALDVQKGSRSRVGSDGKPAPPLASQDPEPIQRV